MSHVALLNYKYLLITFNCHLNYCLQFVLTDYNGFNYSILPSSEPASIILLKWVKEFKNVKHILLQKCVLYTKD